MRNPKPTSPPLSAPVAKALIGRPSSYKPEYCDLVTRMSADGFSLTAIAGSIGVEPGTLSDWRRSFPLFDQACARAKAARLHWWENQALEVVKERIAGPSALIMFALKNAGPDEWRDKIESTVNVNVTLASLIERSMMIDVTPSKALTDKEDSQNG